jgi:hypothetical protein
MINKKKVLILGASRYYSKSIEAARLAGYFVILADKNSQSFSFSFAFTRFDDFSFSELIHYIFTYDSHTHPQAIVVIVSKTLDHP